MSRETWRALGFELGPQSWLRRVGEDDEALTLGRAAELMLAVAGQWGLHPTGVLTPDDVPSPDGPWNQISDFAELTFDGYAHFGRQWGERTSAVRERYLAHGELPDDVDELRAALFCEFRMDRFSWGDDVTLSESDAQGVRYVIANPDFETSPTQKYRRALIARVRELLEGR